VRTLYQKIKRIYKTHEREFSAFALVLGFVIDNLTLQRIDLAFENFVLFFYMTLIAVAILLLQKESSQPKKTITVRAIEWATLFAPFIMQYALGGLFSGLSIFYFRSATLAASWPFLFILVVVLIGNEVYAKKLHKNIVLQLSVFYFSLFSFSIFFVPIIVKDISVWVFILSGAFSLLVIFGFIFILKKYSNEEKVITSYKKITLAIGAVYIGINTLYFLNVIPPIPLSMKERQLGYSVQRIANNYEISVADTNWLQNFGIIQNFQKEAGKPVYFFTSVFAPTKFQKTIIHQWQTKRNDKWVTVSEIPFSISGGRDGGYRGYSYSNKVTGGTWRVQTVLDNGQIIGRKTFTVEIVNKVIQKKKELF